MEFPLKPQQILDSLEAHVHQVHILAKQQQPFERELCSALSLLDTLIQWSYDCYTTIDLEDGLSTEEAEEEEANAQLRVTGLHLQTANKIANRLLVKIVAGDLSSDDDRIEKAARLIAHLAGRGAAGAITRTWHIAYLDGNGDRQEVGIKLHEPAYIGNDIGFKTWGAAPLLAKKLIQQKLIPDMASRTVLELGTGTGLVGLACDKLGAAELTMTDYHHSVLSNVTTNVALNESSAHIAELDFIKVARDESPEWKNRRFDIVIASDLLYEMEHAQYLPIAVSKLMENEFHLMIPLRPTHTKEIELFEETMEKVGLCPQRVTETEKVEEEGLVRYRYYLYTRM